MTLVAASCGGGDSESSETVAPASTAAAPETTQAVAETTAAPESQTTTITAETLGPPAPDFTLQLAAGGHFDLSRQTQPVVVFFWAEW